MTFVSSIIVVEDVLRSRKLYENVLHMKINGDFGIYNVGFEERIIALSKSLLPGIDGRPSRSRETQ